HGLSLAACDLRSDRHGVDAEYDHHTPDSGILGNDDRADRSAGILVLEAQQPQGQLRSHNKRRFMWGQPPSAVQASEARFCRCKSVSTKTLPGCARRTAEGGCPYINL